MEDRRAEPGSRLSPMVTRPAYSLLCETMPSRAFGVSGDQPFPAELPVSEQQSQKSFGFIPARAFAVSFPGEFRRNVAAPHFLIARTGDLKSRGDRWVSATARFDA